MNKIFNEVATGWLQCGDWVIASSLFLLLLCLALGLICYFLFHLLAQQSSPHLILITSSAELCV